MDKDTLQNIIENDNETEIIEYKTNLNDATKIGEYISGLGNSAILASAPCAYLIWGVEDLTKEIVGSTFSPYTAKARFTDKRGKKSNNNIPFITYIEQYLDPRVMLDWNDSIRIDGKHLVVLTINVTKINQPIKFKDVRYIRSGTSIKRLSDFPEKERRIWRCFESSKFELEYAKTGVSYDGVFALLDIDFYVQHVEDDLRKLDQIINSLIANNIIERTEDAFNITNLGAYTLAKNLNNFPHLLQRTVRITRYGGNRKIDNAVFDKSGKMGVANAFNNMVKQIMQQIPHTEVYDEGIRRDVPKFPQIAIRELLANAIVHQDFTIGGMRPMVEIYDDRVEISNPGIPLVQPLRFLDFPPRSRNDELANLLGKFHIVEARGTGIDKVVAALEEYDLPAIKILSKGLDATQVILQEKRKFKDLSITEKNESIYWDACLKYVNGGNQINNKSLRERFKLTENDGTLISKAIANAYEAKLIKPYDVRAGRKFMTYIPYWGQSVQTKYSI